MKNYVYRNNVFLLRLLEMLPGSANLITHRRRNIKVGQTTWRIPNELLLPFLVIVFTY